MIYLASSWRHSGHDAILITLRAAKLEVFDYRETNASFHWREIDGDWENWQSSQYLQSLYHPLARRAFANDKDGLDRCDTLVLLEPSGISAHLELGYAVGAGKKTCIFHFGDAQPELMSKLADFQTDSILALLGWLGVKD